MPGPLVDGRSGRSFGPGAQLAGLLGTAGGRPREPPIAAVHVGWLAFAMPSAKKLKVYRTPIGFHDAYVAAPSQKAALAAWGVDHNLFAKGMADVVTDPDLAKEPLSKPGTVIKRLRGTAAEQLAALASDPPRRTQAPREERRGTREPRAKPRPPPK